jgi:dTMP kinase
MFIVLEGIDGAGGQTQLKLLANQHKDAKLLSYPDYAGPIGRVIDGYLRKQYEFTKELQLLLYFADFLKDKENIQAWQDEQKTIISDRYFTSAVAYQCAQGVPLNKALALQELFELPLPDIVFLLDISAKTSIKRKQQEKGELDRFEENLNFLQELSAFYKKLAEEHVLTKWVVINGEQPIQQVSHEIQSYNWA